MNILEEIRQKNGLSKVEMAKRFHVSYSGNSPGNKCIYNTSCFSDLNITFNNYAICLNSSIGLFLGIAFVSYISYSFDYCRNNSAEPIECWHILKLEIYTCNYNFLYSSIGNYSVLNWKQ